MYANDSSSSGSARRWSGGACRARWAAPTRICSCAPTPRASTRSRPSSTWPRAARAWPHATSSRSASRAPSASAAHGGSAMRRSSTSRRSSPHGTPKPPCSSSTCGRARRAPPPGPPGRRRPRSGARLRAPPRPRAQVPRVLAREQAEARVAARVRPEALAPDPRRADERPRPAASAGVLQARPRRAIARRDGVRLVARPLGGRTHLRPRRDRARRPPRNRRQARQPQGAPRASDPCRIRGRTAGRAATRPCRPRRTRRGRTSCHRYVPRRFRSAAPRARGLARRRVREPRADPRRGLPRLLLRSEGVTLLRLALRSHRSGGIAAAAIGAFAGLLNSLAYAQAAGASHAERVTFAHSMELLGAQLTYLLPRPLQLDTMGGYLTWRDFSTVGLVYAVWAMLAATGAGRG